MLLFCSPAIRLYESLFKHNKDVELNLQRRWEQQVFHDDDNEKVVEVVSW